MRETLLDLDHIPAIDELQEYFSKNHFSTIKLEDIDLGKAELKSMVVQLLEYIKGLMDEQWEYISRNMGLKAPSGYYNKENPFIVLRNKWKELLHIVF